MSMKSSQTKAWHRLAAFLSVYTGYRVLKAWHRPHLHLPGKQMSVDQVFYPHLTEQGYNNFLKVFLTGLKPLNCLGWVFFGTGITVEDFQIEGIWIHLEDTVEDTAKLVSRSVTMCTNKCDLDPGPS